MTNDFESSVKRYIEEIKAQDSKNTVDWDERRTWWQNKVIDLFHQFQTWLQPLIDSGTLQLDISSMKLTEEMLGTYDVQIASIVLGAENLKFTPVGSIIIGGFGRIDVEGPNGLAMLILTSDVSTGTSQERRNPSQWYIAHPRDPRNLLLLTQESFQQIFSDLFGISR